MIYNEVYSLEQYYELFNKYKKSGCLSNNYLMQDELESFIDGALLGYICSDENIVFFVDKGTCYRLYFLLNNLDQIFIFDKQVNYAIEILYRGERYYPSKEIDYWKKCGFDINLVRDYYQGIFSSMNLIDIKNEVKILYARNEMEVLKGIRLFNNSFDPYTGDYIDEYKAKEILESRQLLIAYIDDEPVGFCQFYEKNKTIYLAHIAVNTNYRGRKIGRQLVEAMIRVGEKKSKMRYSLWVQQRNDVAVKMYQSIGYRYAGKSTLSMLNINN